ncbi:hypothetical protein ACE1CD_15670 [Aerosakkonema sp. BLCC-F183]|uniref:hypothetical protein n=1 Tax=Aerosakkonema sp. BLCC-F183 TaxID=3342834 RepID=UPI0035B7A4F8
MTQFHPLSKFEIIQTESGPKETINNWAFASIIWAECKENNSNARQMALDLFSNIIQLDSLLGQNNEAADREAIAIMAFALDEKVEQAFQS